MTKPASWCVSVAVACAIGTGSSVVSAAEEAEELDEVIVTGSRIAQAPGMFTPTPVTSVQLDELESMAPGSLIESLSTLPQFFGNPSPQQALGGQNSGGSNVNLRGAGAQRTLVLLDGRRVVSSNRFSTVDVNSFPDLLLENVETVTGGASASYGTDAVAGVVNFRLDTRYEGLKLRGQGGTTSRDDGDNWEYGMAFGKALGSRLHLVGSFQKANNDAIDSLESLQSRHWFDQSSRVTNPSPTGPTFLRLPYVEATNFTANGLIVDTGAPALNRLQFNGFGNSLTPLPFYGTGNRDAGCQCQAMPFQGYGVSSDDEVAVGYKRSNGFARLGFDLNDNTELFVQAMYADNYADQRRESIALLATWAGRIYSNNAFLTPELQQQIFNGAPAGRTITDNTTGVDEQVRWVGYGQFLPDTADNPLGETRQITSNHMKTFTAGFNTTLGGGALNGWTLDGYVQQGENRQDFTTVNGIRVDRLWFAVDAVRDPSGNIVCRAALPQYDPNGYLRGCAPVNLFGDGRNITPEAAAWVVDPLKVASQWIKQTVAEVTMSGDLGFGLAAGNVAAAFGVSYREEKLDQRTMDPADEFPALPDGRLFSDLGLAPEGLRGLVEEGIPPTTSGYFPGYDGYPGLRFVGTGYRGDNNSSSVQFSSLRAVSGSSDVKEAFAEFSIPLLRDAPLARNLISSLAARWADYSGSGSVWAWKAGLSWELNEQVRLRATQSRDVRAPNLRDRFDQTRGGFTVSDPANGGATVSGATFSGGNPSVESELADTTTVGLVLQPSFLDGFQASVDWYKIKLKDAIAQLTPQQLVTGCQTDPTLCQYVIRAGGTPTGQIVQIDSLFINLARQRIEGVDVELSYRRDVELLGGGPESLGLRIFGTRLMHNSTQNRGGALDEQVGQLGAPLALPKNKATAMLSYSNGPWGGAVLGRFIGGGKLDRTLVESQTEKTVVVDGVSRLTIDDNSVASVFYTDLNANYRPAGIEGLHLFFTVQNLFDRGPPRAPSAILRTGPAELNAVIHDQIGRRYSLGFNYEF